MARIEYKFSKDEIDLIGLGKVSHSFNENTDYIRLNVFQSDDDGGELLYSFASNRPLLGFVWPPIPPTSALITETVIFMICLLSSLIYTITSKCRITTDLKTRKKTVKISKKWKY